MRVVLVAAGGVAAVIALVAVAFGVLDASPEAHAAVAHAAVACVREECGPAPSLNCPPGVAPTCARRSGVCTWDLPAECTTEAPCPNGGSPPLCNASTPQREVPAVASDMPRVTETAPPRAGGISQQASALLLAGDTAGARALLEPRVFGGHASADEVRALEGACKAQHDAECLAALAKRYPGSFAAPRVF